MAAENSKRTIFCFGNPLVKEDSLPLMLIEDLRKSFPDIEFRPAYSVEDAEEYVRKNKELTIIDTVEEIKRVTLLSDKDLGPCAACSLHDFDIGASIRLMKKLGMLRKVAILGIPKGYPKAKALKELKYLIHSSSSL